MENEIFCFCLINLIWENISYLAFVSQQVHWMKKKGVLKCCSVVKTLAHLKKKLALFIKKDLTIRQEVLSL